MNQKKLWDQKWSKRTNEPTNNYAKRCCSLIKNAKYRTLLDIGCGNGRGSLFFARKGFKVTSIDFSKEGLDIFRQKIRKEKIKNIKVAKGSITKLNFGNNSFDIIYAHLCLHYFSDKITTRIFNNLFKILKKNGRIFIKCKSTGDYLCVKGKKTEENMYCYKGQFRHFFDKTYMSNKLAKF